VPQKLNCKARQKRIFLGAAAGVAPLVLLSVDAADAATAVGAAAVDVAAGETAAPPVVMTRASAATTLTRIWPMDLRRDVPGTPDSRTVVPNGIFAP
jgi:hypothetical protein